MFARHRQAQCVPCNGVFLEKCSNISRRAVGLEHFAIFAVSPNTVSQTAATCCRCIYRLFAGTISSGWGEEERTHDADTFITLVLTRWRWHVTWSRVKGTPVVRSTYRLHVDRELDNYRQAWRGGVIVQNIFVIFARGSKLRMYCGDKNINLSNIGVRENYNLKI